MKFSNLRVGAKLWLSVAIFTFSLVSVLVVAGINTGRISAKSKELTLQSSAKLKLVAQWAGLAETVGARMTAAIVSGNPEVEIAFKDLNTADQAKIADLQKQLEGMPMIEAERRQVAAIGEKRGVVLGYLQELGQAKAAGDASRAETLYKQKLVPAMAEYMKTLQDQVTLQEAIVKEQRQQLSVETGRALNISIGMVLLIILAALVGAHFLIRSIRQPLEKAVAIANRIAQGDLTKQTETTRHDEFGDLMRALEKMNASLSKVVSQVRTSSDGVVTASGEIAAGNLDLSSRTEQQAAALEETASSMEQLTATVKQNADNALQANVLAASASEVATKGGTVVAQVVDTMGAINASSNKIVDIISVIDGIAFQTNILALNAAVEAARAGEQGRGFAVVAAEVRNLAQRSAGAAKEIKELIGDSVQKVSTGAELVDQAGVTMTEIVNSVRRVTDIMGEIQAASQEQTAGIENINRAIAQMDESTQQNAALVEEAAAASQSMQDQANALAQAVSMFKLDGIASAANAGVPRKPSRPSTRSGAQPLLPHGASHPVNGLAVGRQPGVKALATRGDDWEEF